MTEQSCFIDTLAKKFKSHSEEVTELNNEIPKLEKQLIKVTRDRDRYESDARMGTFCAECYECGYISGLEGEIKELNERKEEFKDRIEKRDDLRKAVEWWFKEITDEWIALQDYVTESDVWSDALIKAYKDRDDF